MINLDRRELIVGSGLALALIGHDKGAPGSIMMNDSSLSTLRTSGSFEESWHNGDENPRMPHPANAIFNPEYAALLHLYLNGSFELEAKRVHFAVDRMKPNTFEGNSERYEAWIDYFNDGGARPSGYDIHEYTHNALENFIFGSPHHVLIYIKNTHVAYDQQWPVWFGKKLTREVYGETQARKNRSFFDVIQKPVNAASGSQIGIYMKNFHHIRENGNYRRLRMREKRAYAMNINAVGRVAGYPSHAIPIIIDPDTGNMGAGQPHMDW